MGRARLIERPAKFGEVCTKTAHDHLSIVLKYTVYFWEAGFVYDYSKEKKEEKPTVTSNSHKGLMERTSELGVLSITC